MLRGQQSGAARMSVRAMIVRGRLMPGVVHAGRMVHPSGAQHEARLPVDRAPHVAYGNQGAQAEYRKRAKRQPPQPRSRTQLAARHHAGLPASSVAPSNALVSWPIR